MAKTDSKTPRRPDLEVGRLRHRVENMDRLSQDGFSAIETIVKMLLGRLETPAGHQNMGELAKALEMIWEKAVDTQDRINSEAEQVGCNYTDPAQMRRMDASRQAREAGKVGSISDHQFTKRETSDLVEDAHTKALHLHAMLATITGEGGAPFRNMNDEMQENYIWACQTKAEELTNMLEKTGSAISLHA